MAKEYLDRLQAMLDPVVAALPAGITLICKHFFSGAAAYANGQICITLTPVGLAMKLPEEDRDALIKEGASPLRYFPKAPVKKDYVILPQGLRDDAAQRALWVGRAIAYVLP